MDFLLFTWNPLTSKQMVVHTSLLILFSVKDPKQKIYQHYDGTIISTLQFFRVSYTVTSTENCLSRCTAILYRASTGPEQGFPCDPFLTGKNLFLLQGNPVLIAGTLFLL